MNLYNELATASRAASKIKPVKGPIPVFKRITVEDIRRAVEESRRKSDAAR